MQAESIFSIIIGILTFEFVVGQWLEYLNLRAQREDVPAELVGFYDAEKYRTSVAYFQTRTRFSFLTSCFSYVFGILVLVFGLYGKLDIWLLGFVSDSMLRGLLFFLVVLLAADVLSIPFQLYSVFVIEARFGFNKTSLKTFISDKVKGYFLAVLIGAPLLFLLFYCIQVIGAMFWLWFGLASAVFIVGLNVFYTSLILPLFNKLTPLPSGDLKSAIDAYANKVSFPLDNVYVMDGSKRSAKANAFFAGLGSRKKVVLYDTLISNHTIPELIAVLAHEVGHYKKRHIISNLVISIVQIFITLFILSQMIFSRELSLALGGTEWSVHLNLIAFALLYSPVSAVVGFLMNMLSRKFEYEADAYARMTYDGESLAIALKKLSIDSLSTMRTHWLYETVHYSHPNLLKRLDRLKV